MKTSKASAALWARANKRNSARNGMGPADDALHPVVTIPQLIRSVGKNPAALELLASRRHEMTDAQITAVLEAGLPPKASKARTVAKAAPKATPPAAIRARRLANFGLWGKSGAPS